MQRAILKQSNPVAPYARFPARSRADRRLRSLLLWLCSQLNQIVSRDLRDKTWKAVGPNNFMKQSFCQIVSKFCISLSKFTFRVSFRLFQPFVSNLVSRVFVYLDSRYAIHKYLIHTNKTCLVKPGLRK